jgi:oligopeptide/dipeptide ABC transporter ATP-binding protein
MYLGQVVESGTAQDLYDDPKHPYTQLLLSSVPTLDPAESTRDDPVDSTDRTGNTEIPSPIDPPSGCRFRTRCPFAMDVCAEIAPPQVAVAEGRTVACHLYADAPLPHPQEV